MPSNTEYIRLRNVSLDNTFTDSVPQAGREHVAARHQKPSRYTLHRPATMTIVFLVSVTLNFFLMGRILLSHTARDRILTYCEYGSIFKMVPFGRTLLIIAQILSTKI